MSESTPVAGPGSYQLPAIGKPADAPPLRKVALEEHFDYLRLLTDRGPRTDLHDLLVAADYDTTWLTKVGERLVEFEDHRLTGMDAGGIDMAILSHTVPGVQGMLDRTAAIATARDINDFLSERVIARHPDRFAGFATLPLQDPAAAARELERCVNQLGFKGTLINGYTNVGDTTTGEYLDDPKFLPFWEAAAALGVPVYLHPRTPLDQRSYAGHAELLGATWGFGPETATHALRLVYSGLFDRLPTLTLILGHLGEMLPYFAWRIQHCYEYNPGDKRLKKRLQDYLCENVYITTSGNFNDQALISALLTIGADRILFSVDYPYEIIEPACRWIERAPISENDRRKIAHGNARALFDLPARRD